MEKKSRFELIKIVEAQKEQLTRYETRLRGKRISYFTRLCFMFFSGKDKLELVLRLILLNGCFSSELRTAPYLGLTFEQSKKAALFK